MIGRSPVRLLAFTLMPVVGLAGCGGLDRYLDDQVEVHADSLVVRPRLPTGLGDLLGGGVALEASVRVRNRSWFDLTMTEADWSAYLDGRKIASGILASPTLLPSEKETPLSMTGHASLVELGLGSLGALVHEGAALSYEVDARVELFGIGLRRHLSFAGGSIDLGLMAPAKATGAGPERIP